MARTTTRLGLIVWDSNSDEFLHTDLINNWDALEAKVKLSQAGTAAVASGSYTGPTTAGTIAYFTKNVVVTFPVAFPSAPTVVAITDTLGCYVRVVTTSATQVTLQVVTQRNDGPAVNVNWAGILQ